MDTWPFPSIPPDAFEALTDNERHTLEALTRSLLAHVDQRQQLLPASGDSNPYYGQYFCGSKLECWPDAVIIDGFVDSGYGSLWNRRLCVRARS